MTRLALVLVSTLLGAGCSSGDFECGSNGGTCQDGEVCVTTPDGCSACAQPPAACEGEPTCECLMPLDGSTLGDFACSEGGRCDVGDPPRVTCHAAEWSCG